MRVCSPDLYRVPGALLGVTKRAPTVPLKNNWEFHLFIQHYFFSVYYYLPGHGSKRFLSNLPCIGKKQHQIVFWGCSKIDCCQINALNLICKIKLPIQTISQCELCPRNIVRIWGSKNQQNRDCGPRQLAASLTSYRPLSSSGAWTRVVWFLPIS